MRSPPRRGARTRALSVHRAAPAPNPHKFVAGTTASHPLCVCAEPRKEEKQAAASAVEGKEKQMVAIVVGALAVLYAIVYQLQSSDGPVLLQADVRVPPPTQNPREVGDSTRAQRPRAPTACTVRAAARLFPLAE